MATARNVVREEIEALARTIDTMDYPGIADEIRSCRNLFDSYIEEHRRLYWTVRAYSLAWKDKEGFFDDVLSKLVWQLRLLAKED